MTDYTLAADDHHDLADALGQDKALRWLERDRARAQAALLGASADVDDEVLRALQVEFALSRDRLEQAKREILDRLLPQFERRARARSRGSDVVVFTPAEEMRLTLPERHDLMTSTRRNTLAFELKDLAQERLREHGWIPEDPKERKERASGVTAADLPLPSPRQWLVYAVVAATVGSMNAAREAPITSVSASAK